MMSKNNKIISLIFLIVGLTYSCAPIYIPSAHNIPQVNNKGEFQLGAVMGTNGVDLQGSYAVADNQAVMATISGPITTEDNLNRHVYFEAGYGLYNKNPEWLRMSAFGGFGIGAARGESHWSINGKPYERVTKGSYMKPFIQGNIGAHSKVIDAGLSSRLGLVFFNYAEVDGQQVDGNLASLQLEPIAYVNLGWKQIKLNAYGGVSYPVGQNIAFEYFPFMFGLGLQFYLNDQDSN